MSGQDGDGGGASPLWLGLDLSTQSLKLVLLPDEPGEGHVYLDSIEFAQDLPQYQTEHGMHISDGDHGETVGTINSIDTITTFNTINTIIELYKYYQYYNHY